MAKGDAEYRQLSDAMNHHTPPCSGDPRFILDRHEINPDELMHIAATICRPCPLRHACAAYAETARPKAGIWAGRIYTAATGRPRKEDA